MEDDVAVPPEDDLKLGNRPLRLDGVTPADEPRSWDGWALERFVGRTVLRAFPTNLEGLTENLWVEIVEVKNDLLRGRVRNAGMLSGIKLGQEVWLSKTDVKGVLEQEKGAQ